MQALPLVGSVVALSFLFKVIGDDKLSLLSKGFTLLALTIAGINWYINYGRFATVSRKGGQLIVKGILGTNKIQISRIERIKKSSKVRIPFFRWSHVIVISYKSKDGKERKIRFLSKRLVKGKIPNLLAIKSLVDKSKQVNF